MKILVSNDDGINSNGIKALIETLSKYHDVYVVAPDRERSAAAHSLTLHTPLRVEELSPRYGEKRSWQSTGTPGDCIKIAINAILSPEEQPDLIISGINHGPNLGSDILYSGTVSCAIEGVMLGIPSIATSLVSMSNEYEEFKVAAEFISSMIEQLKEYEFPKKTVLNVNIPGVNKEDIAGVVVTELGSKMITDKYEKRVDPRGKVYYWLAGELFKTVEENNTDITAILDNKISITPLTYNMTNLEQIPKIKSLLCTDNKCNWFNLK